MVFNDISHEFTGIQSAFTLTTGFGDSKTNAIGFSTNNGCVLVNDAFQQPSFLSPQPLTPDERGGTPT